MFSTVLQLVTVLTITFFLLLDGGRIVNFLLAQVRPEHQERVRQVAADIYGATGGYVAGALALATAAGHLDLHHAQHPRRPVRGAARGADGVLRPDPARRLDDRRRARRRRHAVRRLPGGHDHLGRLRARLPAGREQRLPAARLPPHGQPAPARGDHGDPHRVEPARGARRAGGDPDRRRDPDRAQGHLGEPRRRRRRRHRASRSRPPPATSRRARSSCRPARRPDAKQPRSARAAGAAAAPARPRARARARAAAAARRR